MLCCVDYGCAISYYVAACYIMVQYGMQCDALVLYIIMLRRAAHLYVALCGPVLLYGVVLCCIAL